MDDEIGLRRFHAAVVPHFGNPVVVDGMSKRIGVAVADKFVAYDVGQFGANHLVHIAVWFDFHGVLLRWLKVEGL